MGQPTEPDQSAETSQTPEAAAPEYSTPSAPYEREPVDRTTGDTAAEAVPVDAAAADADAAAPDTSDVDTADAVTEGHTADAPATAGEAVDSQPDEVDADTAAETEAVDSQPVDVADDSDATDGDADAADDDAADDDVAVADEAVVTETTDTDPAGSDPADSHPVDVEPAAPAVKAVAAAAASGAAAAAAAAVAKTAQMQASASAPDDAADLDDGPPTVEMSAISDQPAAEETPDDTLDQAEVVDVDPTTDTDPSDSNSIDAASTPADNPDAAGDNSDDIFSGLAGDGHPSRAPKIWAGIGIGVVVLAGLYVGAQWALASRIPTGTTVAGVDVGGLNHDLAVDTLNEELAPRSTQPVSLTADTVQTTLDPTTTGLSLDVDATADQLTEFSLNPARLWAHLFGGEEHPPVITVDQGKLDAAAAVASDELTIEPVNGTVAFEGTSVVSTDAETGITVPPRVIAETVTRHWLVEPGAIDLPVDTTAPDIDADATELAIKQAHAIVSASVTVEASDQSASLPVDLLASATTFEPDHGVLAPTFNGEALRAAVIDKTTNLITEPVDARFTFANGAPQITGGTAGTTIDPQTLADAVMVAALGDLAPPAQEPTPDGASPEPGDTDAPANPDEPAETPGDDAPADDNHNRVAVIELVNAEPETTRETLEALGVREVVSSFSTGLTADSIRTGNLRRGSELITGTLVRPGEEFSLLRALGPITAANGFGNAPIIQGGQLVPGVGGGLSQLATNMYNVGFFAGFEDIEHRPHSQFIPRYPAGREATIVAGSLDMRWRNNTPYGAVVQSWVAGGQLHSRVWSTPYFTVETSASGRSNVRPATTIQGSGGNCVPSSPGQAGFTITNHRRVLRQGQVIINESNTWSYSPANGVSCPSPEPPQHEAGGDE